MSILSWLSWKNPDEVPAHTGTRQEPSLDKSQSGATGAMPRPVQTTGDLLEDNRQLVEKIQLCYGCEESAFNHDLLTLIARYADYVGALPASADNYFAEDGGLFRLGLETGFYALQAADTQIFGGCATITSRQHLESRWRHAAFIAGMCAELHRALAIYTVRDSNSTTWPAFLCALGPWLAEQEAKYVYLEWHPNPPVCRQLSIYALPHVVPTSILQHLAKDNQAVIPQMVASICGTVTFDGPNVLDQLVRRAVALVVDKDLRECAKRTGGAKPGTHLGQYLVDTMRRLVASASSWTPNIEKSRVWLAQDGLFLIWPNAAADIIRQLDTEQLAGMPKSPEQIANALAADGVIVADRNRNLIWIIRPPGTSANVQALKFSNPATLMPPEPHGIVALSANLGPEPGGAGQATPPMESPDMPPPPQYHACHPPPPYQLSLLAPTVETSASTGHDSHRHPEKVSGSTKPPISPDHASAAPATKYGLVDCLRLNVQVTAALRDIIESLNRGAYLACRIVPSGLFIPASCFTARGIDTQKAARSLADVGMLIAAPAGGNLHEYECDGAVERGFIVAPSFIAGFNAAGLASSEDLGA
ncbi:relaxase [Duganella sp. FT92W]|uniref:Relaxase n=1 Tax=Pseudoduganella rivuli TaxID=2666085 RepID=A0A7X2LR91_9BURK|nr:MobH family relaxase [Pseudoduganella rivuli]MRV70563.1 relaxase [Pseudoduganella rivuli]